MSTRSIFRWLVVLFIFLTASFEALAYSECNVENICGHCRATCNQRAYCVSGEFNTVDKKCTRQPQCLCIGSKKLIRLDALTARRVTAP